MIGYIFFAFWRLFQILTLIPTLGMLAYFVHNFQQANRLTPSYVLTLFIVSVLAAAWAIVTLFRRKSTRASSHYVSFIDLCFVGAFIAGVYELRGIANADCASFNDDGTFSVSLGPNGFDGSSPFSVNINQTCAMLKASFAFGIMNCIFFFMSACILLFMHRNRDEERVVVKEERRYSNSRRSHDSRRGHSRSGSRNHRSSRDGRRTAYV